MKTLRKDLKVTDKRKMAVNYIIFPTLFSLEGIEGMASYKVCIMSVSFVLIIDV